MVLLITADEKVCLMSQQFIQSEILCIGRRFDVRIDTQSLSKGKYPTKKKHHTEGNIHL